MVSFCVALVDPLLVDPGLLVALEVRAGLEALAAVAAEVRPLSRVGVQMLPQMCRFFKSVITNRCNDGHFVDSILETQLYSHKRISAKEQSTVET